MGFPENGWYIFGKMLEKRMSTGAAPIARSGIGCCDSGAAGRLLGLWDCQNCHLNGCLGDAICGLQEPPRMPSSGPSFRGCFMLRCDK